MSTTEPWFQRYAFLVFVAIGLMGLVIAVPVILDPANGAPMFERLDGMTAPAIVVADAEAWHYLKFVYSFAFTATFGLDLMTVLVAVFAFRHGARWAWVAFLYWPLLFIHNALTYEDEARIVQIGMLALTAVALAAMYRKTWLSRSNRPA